jgi:hypothetical protein
MCVTDKRTCGCLLWAPRSCLPIFPTIALLMFKDEMWIVVMYRLLWFGVVRACGLPWLTPPLCSTSWWVLCKFAHCPIWGSSELMLFAVPSAFWDGLLWLSWTYLSTIVNRNRPPRNGRQPRKSQLQGVRCPSMCWMAWVHVGVPQAGVNNLFPELMWRTRRKTQLRFGALLYSQHTLPSLRLRK